MKGMMLHQGGSTHEWVEEKHWDLIVTLDDVDSEIYSAFFVEEEDTWNSFNATKEVILEHGLFCSLYVDQGSHYFTTPKEGGKVDREHPTQFGHAMNQLGIDLIAAYSRDRRPEDALNGCLGVTVKCCVWLKFFIRQGLFAGLDFQNFLSLHKFDALNDIR